MHQRQKPKLPSWLVTLFSLTTAEPKSFSSDGVWLGAARLNTKEGWNYWQNYVNFPFMDMEVRVALGNCIMPWNVAEHLKSTKNQHKNNT